MLQADSAHKCHRLGAGTFAEVRKAVDVETGNLRAVKVRPQKGTVFDLS